MMHNTPGFGVTITLRCVIRDRAKASSIEALIEAIS
jgi:hypothetical protein